MKPEVATRLRILASVVTVLVAVTVLLLGWYYGRIRASLPQLDGRAVAAGLSGAVTIDRDALGVPTIRGANRVDVARALGWVHAQDRFFQMDVLRRAAAGELAEVFGVKALPRDRAVRMHGFRKLAEKVFAQLPPRERQVVDAYAAGVNAGLTALRERPFEYVVLREKPQPWRPEDSVLVTYAMALDLQDSTGVHERSLMTLRDELGMAAVGFFSPLVAPNDAALDGSTAPLPAMPGPKVIDIHKTKTATRPARRPPDVADAAFPFPRRDPDAIPGSNGFALAGTHTANGAALLANDMHLELRVPNTWYRASLEYPDHKITGVTLPGAPAVVTGSNGSVAWGFTNAYADTADLVVVDVNTSVPSLYSAPGFDELQKIEERQDTIHVKGERDVVVEYGWTVWGPIVGTRDGRPLALHWTEHDPNATNFQLMEMEDAKTVADGLKVAHRAGIPVQNMLLADRAGAVAWTIAGRLPKRVGFDGRLPVSWTYGDRRWDGYWAEDEIPVVQPSDGRLWTANQRMIGGDALTKVGDGTYPRPARAAQIRDDLKPLERATPRDLLAVQLDNRARFLEPWHELMMKTLTPEVAARTKERTVLRSFAEKWEGVASTEAVSYRLTREFRTAVYARVCPAIFATCREKFPAFDWHAMQLEPAMWAMLKEKPVNLLNPDFASWDDLLVAAVDDVIALINRQGVTLPQANWGWRNTARIRHPFGYILPGWLSGWLNMPADPLPGDDDMPRVGSPTHGASERCVVAPGHEAEGIFHMPCGQSGHPLSPYYRAGHEAWVRGDPTPFLPGKKEHELTLTP